MRKTKKESCITWWAPLRKKKILSCQKKLTPHLLIFWLLSLAWIFFSLTVFLFIHSFENDTFLHRKRISPRKLFLGQGKVFPRAVFNPPRVGLYIPSEARAVIETQGGLKTARGYTFVWPRSNFQGEILLWSRMVLSFILAGIQTASECLEQPLKAKKYPQKMRQKMRQEMNFPGKKLP